MKLFAAGLFAALCVNGFAQQRVKTQAQADSDTRAYFAQKFEEAPEQAVVRPAFQSRLREVIALADAMSAGSNEIIGGKQATDAADDLYPHALSTAEHLLAVASEGYVLELWGDWYATVFPRAKMLPHFFPGQIDVCRARIDEAIAGGNVVEAYIACRPGEPSQAARRKKH